MIMLDHFLNNIINLYNYFELIINIIKSHYLNALNTNFLVNLLIILYSKKIEINKNYFYNNYI